MPVDRYRTTLKRLLEADDEDDNLPLLSAEAAGKDASDEPSGGGKVAVIIVEKPAEEPAEPIEPVEPDEMKPMGGAPCLVRQIIAAALQREGD